ncbi:MAG: phenylalanine--tRNA ligase subunit beta [Proteobacteria bacterium]|nr:phenylalanine--tRNA ligase subunit beta [Pseudomonadota bacterium]
MLISLKLIDKLFLQLPLSGGAASSATPCWKRWDIGKFAEIFTRQGFEVESRLLRGSGFENVVVGRINSAERHPKADKLQVCQVQTASGDVRQIVCGAANARAGLFVAVALPGARLPNGLEIKISKIRDAESCGMLCSREELGLPVDADRDGNGIWELHHEPSCGLPESELKNLLGQPVFEALGLDDVVFELNVTPNRPDILGHEGAARELCAGLNRAGQGKFEILPWKKEWTGQVAAKQILTEAQERSEVQTQAGSFRASNAIGAPTFFVALDDVKVATTPAWIRNSLEALGQKSINSVVDAGNLILLCFAQPNHAFDLAKLNSAAHGGKQLTLRFASENEFFAGLDGKERSLSSNDCVVADEKNVQALLGVIGGEKSKVSDQSVSLVLEFANPHPVLVRRTSRRHGRKTDSSFAFEKGIDVFRRAEAAEKLIGLISALQPADARSRVKYCGSVAALPAASFSAEAKSFFPDAADSAKQLDAAQVRPLKNYKISYNDKDLAVRVGAELIPFAEQLKILGSLGFLTEKTQDSAAVQVTVPSWRRLDVAGAADLVEEIVRVVGIDHVPALPMTSAGKVVPDDSHLSFFESTANRMVSLGYHETAGFHFMRADDWKKLNLAHVNVCGEPVALLNPIIKDEPLMQTTLLSGLLRKVAFNLNYGNRRGQLFEISRTFQNADSKGRRVFADNGSGIGLAAQLQSTSATLAADSEYSSSAALPLSREATAPERPSETPRLCGVVFGSEEEKEWLNSGERDWTLHAVAAHLDEILSVYSLKIELKDVPESHPMRTALHPGRSAHVLVKASDRLVPVGWIAEFHPSVLRNFEIEGRCLGFEINLATALAVAAEVKLESGTATAKSSGAAPVQIRLPMVERDFAFLVAESVTADKLIQSVRTAVVTDGLEPNKIPARLVGVRIFDVYRGQGVPSGHKSVALRVMLLPTERTLVEADISCFSQAVIQRVGRECEAQLRG